MKIKKYFSAFILILSAAFLFAQESQVNEKLVLTVEESVKLALENNKTLKSSAIDLEIQKRASDYSWNSLLPGLQLSGSLARSNDKDNVISSIESNLNAGKPLAFLGGVASAISSGADAALGNGFLEMGKIPSASSVINDTYGSEEAAMWHPVGNLSISWAFNAALIEQISLSKKQYEAGKISYEQSVKEMETNIRKLFYGILLQQENLNIQKDSLNNAKARYEQALINYRNGLVPELQVLNSQVSYENQKPTVLSLEQQIIQQKNTFAFLLGIPFGKEIELSGTIDVEYIDVDAQKLYKEYCDNSLEIQNIKKQIEVAQSGLTAQRLSTFTPSLAVNWGLQPTVMNITKNWFDKDNFSDNGNLTLTLVYPNIIDMLPFSANMQKIKDTQQNIEKAQLGLSQMEQNMEIEVHKLVDNLNKSRENIKAMERNVELAQKAYDSTLRAYNSGTQELLAVKDSESSLNQSRLGLMNEKYNYISAVLDLETKLNIKLQNKK